MAVPELFMLPEDLVSTILSLTSPADACRSRLVSSTLRSAADSDLVWERLLPSDYRNILSRSVTPLKFSSKKELFFHLCNPILLDGGNKSLTLDKFSGKKSYVLSARQLSIAGSNEQRHWSWKSMAESSMFSEVAVLRRARQIEIQGRIRTRVLTPNTTYAAYLVLKISETAYGLDSIPSEISVEVGNRVSNNTAYLRRPDNNKRQMECLLYWNRMQVLRLRVVNEGDKREPCERDDGWMEIELGDFFSGEDDEEVKMSLMEVKGNYLKGGLIIQGIQLRPKH